MELTSRRIFLLTALALGTLVTHSPRAVACAAPRCASTHVSTTAGAHLPANAPAIPVVLSRDPGFLPADPSDVSLVADDGTVLPITVDDDPGEPNGDGVLVRPSRPLAPGGYSLRIVERCVDKQSVPPHAVEHSFSVTPEVAFPSVLGTVSAHSRGTQSILAPSGGLCNTAIDAAVVDVEITPSEAVARFAPVASYTLLVGGRHWATSDYGSLATTSPFMQMPRQVTRIFARCDGAAQPGDDSGLLPGVYAAELRAHLAGVDESPPPVRFRVELECSEDSEPPSAASGGCSLTGRPAGTPWLTLVPLAFALALRGRCRRRTSKPG